MDIGTMTPDLGSVVLDAIRTANRVAARERDAHVLSLRVTEKLVEALDLVACSLELTGVPIAAARAETMRPPAPGGLMTKDLLLPIRWEHTTQGFLKLVFRADSAVLGQDMGLLHALAEDLGLCFHNLARAGEIEAELQRRRSAEEALRESDRRQRMALEAAELGTARCDLGRGQLELDARAAAHYGLPARCTFDDLLARVEPDDRPLVRAARVELERTGATALEFRVVHPDGRTRWLSIRERMSSEAGVAFGTTRDVTVEHTAHAAEHERQALHDQLTRIHATVPGVIYTFRFHADGRPSILAGEPAAELFGLPIVDLEEDMTPVLRRLPAPDAHAMQTAISESIRGMSPFQLTFRYEHPTRGLRWLQAMSIPHRGGDGTVVWQGVVSDVTEHRHAEEALRESEERYRNLLENVEDVIFRLDLQGICAYVSPAVERYGYTPAEIEGRPFLDFVHPEDRSRLAESVARSLAGEHVVVEFRVVAKSGRASPVRASSRQMTEGNAVVGLAGVLTDISQQREIENQLRAAQKMEAVGRLAGGIAHDFNNLLSVIGAFAELALETLRVDDPLHGDLSEILKATRRATALTRQLLAFSRKQVLQPQVLDLNELLAGVEKMLRRMIGEDIDLVCVPGAELARLRADPGQLEQVLMNLVINARDAMPSGGTLTLTTRNARIDALAAEHLELPAGAYVQLTVVDTGTGMDETVQRRLFEPFFTTKEAGKGTGLGLATAYGIVRQSGGAIRVRSTPGQGSVFEILLPAIDGSVDAQSAPEQSPRGRGPQRAQGTILLVEDEEGVRTLVRRILVSAGYTVLTASNGGEALLLCEEHRAIDLMLSDVVMPGMSGPALARRLASLQPAMRVLFMSGYARDKNDPDLANAPMIDKPFTVDALVGRVRAMFDPPSSRA